MLCPECGLPWLPPERSTRRRRQRRAVAPAVGQNGHQPEPQLASTAGTADETTARIKAAVQASQASSPARLIISTGLFVSGLLLLLAWLEHSPHSMVIFGILAAVFLVMLIRVPSRRQ